MARCCAASRPGATPLRITELPWWARKHEKKVRVAPQTLARKGARFKGDCRACHAAAEQVVFRDD
ncbi:MAG: diheme cytochrome c [Alphaproteobacteria bacterium]|nr:diheme cytochrome c [Alphaproteobacteria bacterium]